MAKKRSGLQKSVENVFKNAVVPEEVKLEYSQMKSEIVTTPQPDSGAEASVVHHEPASATPHRIPNKGAVPIYIKESTSNRRKKSWWSTLTGH